MHRSVFQIFYLVIWCRSRVGCRRVYFRFFTWLSGVGLGRGAEECISEFYLVIWCSSWAGCRVVYFRVLPGYVV